MDFGLTNSDAQFDAANAWREAAIADGWTASPSYEGEPATSMCDLKRDGFHIRVASRLEKGRWKYMAQVTGWGPDGMSIRLPTVYSTFQLIQQQVRHCADCGKDDVDTFRVGFAGRVCAVCLPEARKKCEYPGWAD